jgi:hypothetical protein
LPLSNGEKPRFSLPNAVRPSPAGSPTIYCIEEHKGLFESRAAMLPNVHFDSQGDIRRCFGEPGTFYASLFDSAPDARPRNVRFIGPPGAHAHSVAPTMLPSTA